MAKSFDPQAVNPLVGDLVEELIITRGNLPPTKPFEAAVKTIDEYDGRMRIKAIDKFDVSVFIAAVNLYLSKMDMEAHRAKGALVLYMDTEVSDKIFRAAGFQVPYDEDDESMMALCGKLCQSIAEGLRDKLSAQGYAAMTVSPAAVYKNTIPEGVEFDKNQDEKQEISFFFLKHKALVIEWTLTPIPRK